MEAEFDKDGYPTEKYLKAIEKYDFLSWDKVRSFIQFCKDGWSYPDRFRITGKNVLKVYMSTGGWSGNESIIHAMQKNRVFWMVSWVKSIRGGHYWLEIRRTRYANPPPGKGKRGL